MASGWANDGAVQDQIDSTIDDAVARARRELPKGESLHECDECGATIPEAPRFQDITVGVRRTASFVDHRMGLAQGKRLLSASQKTLIGVAFCAANTAAQPQHAFT